MRINKYITVSRVNKFARDRGHEGVCINSVCSVIFFKNTEIPKLIKILKHFDKKLNK